MNAPSRPIETDNATEIREGHVAVHGGNVWYKVIGCDRKGIPLMVVHGGPGASHDYLEPLQALADDRPVIFYDQLGCGNSDRPDDTSLWNLDRFVDELEQVRASLGLEKMHLLGQSWGACIAVDYVLSKRPGSVAKMVLSGPLLSTPRWVEDQRRHVAKLPDDMQKVIRHAEETGDFGSPEYQAAMMHFYRKHVCRLDEWPECLNRAFEKLNSPMYEYMWGPSEFSVIGTLKEYDRTSRLAEIAIPVLFTCGEHDEATPATVQFYQECLPGSEVAVFDGASHEHHLEKPEQFLRVIREFLRSP